MHTSLSVWQICVYQYKTKLGPTDYIKAKRERERELEQGGEKHKQTEKIYEHTDKEFVSTLNLIVCDLRPDTFVL